MSFPHPTMACEGIQKETPGTSGVLVPGADASRNPRTIGRSGCTPAEPCPPNRKSMVDQRSSILNPSLTNHIPAIRGQNERCVHKILGSAYSAVFPLCPSLPFVAFRILLIAALCLIGLGRLCVNSLPVDCCPKIQHLGSGPIAARS